MSKRRILVLSAFALLILLAFIAVSRLSNRPEARSSAPAGVPTPPHPALIHGRVTTITGATHTGALRSGDGEEELWTDLFVGRKKENVWAGFVPPGQLPTETEVVNLFGVRLRRGERPASLERPFVTPYGNIDRIDAESTQTLRVTLRNGTTLDLDRNDASDFDDGIEVRDASGAVNRLDNKLVRSIELFAGPDSDAPLDRLYGTVSTGRGDFVGLIRWNREHAFGTDPLEGEHGERVEHIPFGEIRSIARTSSGAARVVLRDGRTLELTGRGGQSLAARGVLIDDPRYGRVTVKWDALDQVSFGPASAVPTRATFAPGRSLRGTVTTLDGAQLGGRLVYDLDESETTDTFDVPAEGLNYQILFDQLASISPPGPDHPSFAVVTLRNGTRLELPPRGDLDPTHGGMLIFQAQSSAPRHVEWSAVARIDFEP